MNYTGDFRSSGGRVREGSPTRDLLTAHPVDSTDTNSSEMETRVTSRVTTTPRKRVVLNFNSITHKISSDFVVKNRSPDVLAFRADSTWNDGYDIHPMKGTVQPGETLNITVALIENLPIHRDLDKDKFTVEIATCRSGQNALAEFVPEEKHTLFIALSPSGKEHLFQLNADHKKELQRQFEMQRSFRRMALGFCGAAFAVFNYYLLYVDHCPCTETN